MTKFIHTADWQIGRQFGSFPEEDRSALFDARFEAIRRIGQLATEHDCDAVLVAGDVFDLQAVSERTIRRTFNAMDSFSGPWVMLPGNHDAALAESVWTLSQRLGVVPNNVRLALTPEPIELPNLIILPAPLTQRQTHNDLTAWFDSVEDTGNKVRVGLAHGSIEGELHDEIDATNPIARGRAETAGLDYLALGDWHGLKRIDARTWYSGTPEPERFKDNDPGHSLLVEIAAHGEQPAVTPLNTASYQWYQWHRSLAVESDIDQLLDELSALPEGQVLDLTLSGTVTLGGEARLRDLLAATEGRQRSVRARLDALRILPTEEDIAELKADGYVAEVLETLKARQSEDDPVVNRALLVLANQLRGSQSGRTVE